MKVPAAPPDPSQEADPFAGLVKAPSQAVTSPPPLPPTKKSQPPLPDERFGSAPRPRQISQTRNARKQFGKPLQFKVAVKDPDGLLKGTFAAEATEDGLEMKVKNNQVVIPVGTKAKYLGGNKLAVDHEDRRLELTVSKHFHYVHRLARDLADFLNGNIEALEAQDYRMPWYIYAPAVLPIGIPILTLGGAVPAAAGFGLAGAGLVIAQQERWPAALRIAASTLLALAGYGALGLVLFLGYLNVSWWNTWQTFTPQDQSFSILMPGKPKEKVETIATVVGNASLHMHVVDRGSSAFLIGYADLPPAAANAPLREYLDGVRGGMLQGVNGKVIVEKHITLDGHTGREFSFTSEKPKGKGAARIYRVKGRLYELLVLGRNIDPESADVRKFFDSFKLSAPGDKIKTPNQATTADLILRLKNGDIQGAARALAEKGPAAKEAIPVLTEALEKENPPKRGAPDNGNNRLELAVALNRIDPKNQYAVRNLNDCLTFPNPHVNVVAAYELARLDPRNDDAVLRLCKMGGNGPEARKAMDFLGKLGPAAKVAMPELLKQMTHGTSPDLRQYAQDAALKIDRPAVLPYLIKALDSDLPGIPNAAAERLGAMGAAAKEAIPALRAAEKKAFLQRAASEAIKKIEGR
jgi:hypothetical protein